MLMPDMSPTSRRSSRAWYAINLANDSGGAGTTPPTYPTHPPT